MQIVEYYFWGVWYASWEDVTKSRSSLARVTVPVFVDGGDDAVLGLESSWRTYVSWFVVRPSNLTPLLQKRHMSNQNDIWAAKITYEKLKRHMSTQNEKWAAKTTYEKPKRYVHSQNDMWAA
jgi:hypothetical protein